MTKASERGKRDAQIGEDRAAAADARKMAQTDEEHAKGEDPSRERALIAARAAYEKKASDILIQEVRKALSITDYFVIVTGANKRQVDAITEAIEEALRLQVGAKPIGREGTLEQTWVLLDYGDVVVHVFQPELREFYRLESLRSDAPLVRVSEAGIEEPIYSERIDKLIDQARLGEAAVGLVSS